MELFGKLWDGENIVSAENLLQGEKERQALQSEAVLRQNVATATSLDEKMTQENKESAQNTAATYKFDGDFLFGRHRVLPRCG